MPMRRLSLLLLVVVLAGCTSFTNLTASRQPRNVTGLYIVEAEWNIGEQSIRPESLHPFVLVGTEAYPMRQTMHTTNRWEAPVPIGRNISQIRYRFKLDYDYNRFGPKGA